MNLREAFRKLRARFEQESHQHPGLWHLWLQAVRLVHDPVLASVAADFGQPLAEVTRWPRENESVDFSCFVGGEERVEEFRRLAAEGRHLFVQFCERLGGEPRHTTYDPPIAWLADVYHQANLEPQPQLRVEHLALGEWPTAGGTNKILRWPPDKQSGARLEALRKEYGEPLAVYRVQALVQDVFTASATIIAGILEESAADPSVGTALSPTGHQSQAPASPGGALTSAAATAPAAGIHAVKPRSTASPRTRPGWVNQAGLIGPCSLSVFAGLMAISPRQLYRLINDKGQVWKENGPTTKKFYFHHHDPVTHRRLQEAFERNRSQKRQSP